MKLYEYCVILKPKSGKKDAKVVIQTTTILANDKDEISLKAIEGLLPEYKNRVDEIEIVTRAFNNTPFVVYKDTDP